MRNHSFTKAAERISAFAAAILLFFFSLPAQADSGSCHILLLLADGDASVRLGEDFYPSGFDEITLQEAAVAFFGACMTDSDTRCALIRGNEKPEILYGITGSKSELITAASGIGITGSKRDFCVGLSAAAELLNLSGCEKGTVTLVFSLPPDTGNTNTSGLYSAASFPFASQYGSWYFPYMNAVRSLCEELSGSYTLNTVLLLPDVPVSGNAEAFFAGMQSFAADITNGTVTVALGNGQLQSALVSAGMSAASAGKPEKLSSQSSSVRIWACICGGGALIILIAVAVFVIGRMVRRKKHNRAPGKRRKTHSSFVPDSQLPPGERTGPNDDW